MTLQIRCLHAPLACAQGDKLTVTPAIKTVVLTKANSPLTVPIIGTVVKGGVPPVTFDYVTSLPLGTESLNDTNSLTTQSVTTKSLTTKWGTFAYPFSTQVSADGNSIILTLDDSFVYPGSWYYYIRWPIGYTVKDSSTPVPQKRGGSLFIRIKG